MRRSWLWGLGLTLLAGLSATTGRAGADDDDKPAAGPRAHYGRGPGLMERLFQPSEKPAPKKPAKKDADTAKDKVEKPAVDSAAVIRAREQAAYERRTQVCLRLMDLANQHNDEELFRRAEELDKRAWAIYRQRTAHLPASNAVSESDEEVLDRHLGNKTATAPSADDLTSGAAKAKNRNRQAAVREVKP